MNIDRNVSRTSSLYTGDLEFDPSVLYFKFIYWGPRV